MRNIHLVLLIPTFFSLLFLFVPKKGISNISNLRACISMLFFLFITITFISCRKNDTPIAPPITPPVVPPTIPTKVKISGFIQKGPFINTSNVTISELDSSLVQTGKTFTSQVFNDIGSFSTDSLALTSKYVQLRCDGYYFNETKGSISSGQLTLYALSDITNSAVNINMLTHLEKPRVEYLVKNGMSFTNAKKEAQTNIMNIFKFAMDGNSNSENLTITSGGNNNAILLAISLIIQGDRSVGDLTELLARMSTDLQSDGILNVQSNIDSLRKSVKQLNLFNIRQNLQNRYQTLGVTATIPPFETYTTSYLNSIYAADTTGGPVNGLVAYWPFSGNTHDESGSGNDGTIFGGVTLTTNRFGVPNNAFHFNGSNGTHIQTTYMGEEITQQHARTISLWAKFNSVGNEVSLVTYGRGLPYTKQIFSVTTQNVQINGSYKPAVLVDYGGAVFGTGSNVIIDGKWHNLILTYRDSVCPAGMQNCLSSEQNFKIFDNTHFYIDGILYANNYSYNIYTGFGDLDQSGLGYFNTTPNLPFDIGRFTVADPRTFLGDLDDIRVYNRVLTDAEILYLSSH